MKIFYSGAQGEGWGWGCFGTNIVREFKRLGVWAERETADVIFQPLADNNFTPTAPLGKRNIAMSFFEFDLGPDAKANADKFETVFVGSTWCLERMKANGITNGRVLIQGVDDSIFFPQFPRTDKCQFRIFSGGKFEYRKGQDIVIAAFTYFAKRHPEAHLVCSWFNPWPDLIKTMSASEFLTVGAAGATQFDLYRNLLISAGIPPHRFTVLPQLSQSDLAAQMADTDCGLFPNRCEGGTNLVLMEYLSTGRPAAANLKTGHADLAGAAIREIECGTDANGWAKQELSAVIRALEAVYEFHFVNTDPPRWTWEAAAKTILAAANE